jgi:hypothetical protein
VDVWKNIIYYSKRQSIPYLENRYTAPCCHIPASGRMIGFSGVFGMVLWNGEEDSYLKLENAPAFSFTVYRAWQSRKVGE